MWNIFRIKSSWLLAHKGVGSEAIYSMSHTLFVNKKVTGFNFGCIISGKDWHVILNLPSPVLIIVLLSGLSKATPNPEALGHIQ